VITVSSSAEPPRRSGSYTSETSSARLLFVHPNTVRYRLRRVSELTGLTPTDGRAGFTLWVAIVLGRQIHKST
jgi:DNA-binding PucR family transcriptional regulator